MNLRNDKMANLHMKVAIKFFGNQGDTDSFYADKQRKIKKRFQTVRGKKAFFMDMERILTKEAGC